MDVIRLVSVVLGGLALFVYGMGLMSDGLKETAGAKLKTALGYMTRNRFCAILAGLGVTALIQSSSATTITAAFAAIGTNVNAKRTALAHARESLAVLSVFTCLRDITRHLGNIAVRAPQFA